ncbi:MAG: polymerase, sigma-24 subunit, subfamily [Sedimentibacter sp.]|jgi:RNA polymerase sigma-70 factor (ECF subfamily)|nr:polymerase, sigma-24 subunit, subfamily [Sedimentibacter sp.]
MKRDNLVKQIADYIIIHKERYYRLAYSYVRNVDDALDVVQDSIYKALSSVDSLKDPDHINPWFYRIVINCSLDLLRKQKKVVTVDDEFLKNCNLKVVDKYTDIDLHRALDSLPENCRSIIILRYFEDMKLDEIAEILNENISTIKSRLYKSLEALEIKMEA